MPSNSPAATEPPQTPENDATNDVVRKQIYMDAAPTFFEGFIIIWFDNLKQDENKTVVAPLIQRYP